MAVVLGLWFSAAARAASPVVFNELMARNEGAVISTSGRVADWLEFFNPTAGRIDLSGLGLSVNDRVAVQWRFPAGSVIEAQGYLVIWCDGSRRASTRVEAEMNMGRSLPAEGGAVHLFNAAGAPEQSVAFGFQLVNLSIGRTGSGWRLLNLPSAGSANASAATLGNANGLRVNEWMASPGSGDDWFEVFNPGAFPVDMAGMYLTDDPSPGGATKYTVGPLTFVPPGGWVLWFAASRPENGPHHVNFSLSAQGDTIRLLDPSRVVVDSVTFPAQTVGVSEGRLPDGASNVVRFGQTPTPGEANYAPLTEVVINEVLSHTDPPLEDAIELLNVSDRRVDISHWYLSNTPDNLKKFRIPAGTILEPGGFKVFYEYQFNAAPGIPGSFNLNSAHGDDVNLSSADATGNLTGYRARQRFGASQNGVSFGRILTTLGPEFVPMAARTFGADEPGSLVEFRSGTGKPNSAAKIGPVVINEIHYHPVVAPGQTPAENPTDEFVELHNFADIRMPLFDPLNPENRWQLAEGVEFEFPRGTVIPAHGHVLVVNFDPSGDSVLEASFRNRYGVPSDVQIFGPLGGRLANESDVVELVRPDPPQKPPHPDAGFVPYLLVEQVAYSDVLPWPVNLELNGHSLQRRAGRNFSNDAVNWKAAPPTPGRPNFASGSSDLDADGMPDDWETRHGLQPNQASDAMTDADFDGLSNYGEYLCGTDPKDPASHWRILEAGLRAGSVWIRFPAAPMTAYTVQARSRVTGSAWTRVGDIPAGGAARIVEWQDPEPVSGSSGERYYRVVTPPIP